MKAIRLKNFDDLEVKAAELKTPGVFQAVGYLKIFKESFGEGKEMILLKGEEGYGGFEKVGDKVMFLGMKPVLGKEEVTDYGDIVSRNYHAAWEEFLEWFKENNYRQIRLDYVREDAETFRVLARQKQAFRRVVFVKQEVAPYIDLPESWEEYLERLKRKHRKELKRKIKRLEDQESFYECNEETVKDDFEEFVRLHRLSDRSKEQFMSEKMKEFFWRVKTMRVDGWMTSLCFLKMEGKPVAGVMTFENQEEVWLYNSGFDPEHSYYSVGIVLKAYKIKKAIEEGKKRFDFLRGGERYKYELGGRDLKLYRIDLDL